MIQFTLRLPKELHELVKALAEREYRSLNSQVVYMLYQGVSGAGLPVELSSLDGTVKQEVSNSIRLT